MIVTWTGRGIYALVITLGSLAATVLGSMVIYGDNPNRPHWSYSLAFAFGLILGGGSCWRLGRFWNGPAHRRPRHTIYFLRMEHWGILMILLGIATLISIPFVK